MAGVNVGELTALFSDFNTLFQGGMENDQAKKKLALVALLSTGFPSSSAKNVYAWLDKLRKYRKRKGGRQYEIPVSRKFEVENIPYELSEEMSRDDYEDDKWDVFGPLMSIMGTYWPELQYDSVLNVILDNPVCHTGVSLINNTHPVPYYAATVDNLTTSSLSAGEVEAARGVAAGWKFRDNVHCATQFSHLLVGESLRTAAFNIAQNRTVASGSAQIDNANFGTLTVIVDPALNATAGENNDVDAEHFWFLLDLTKPVKPVGLQIRRVPQLLMDTDPVVIEKTDKIDIVASGRLAALPTFPHLIYGGQATS